MELKDFIGKVVIHAQTKKRYVLYKLEAACIEVKEEKADENGIRRCYCWEVGTLPYDNAIAKGRLIFEDATLLEPFREIYEAYQRSPEGRIESYDYWFWKYS